MNVLEHFQDISTFVFDVDGVLTDGGVLLLENGLQARRMSIKDGFALQLAVKSGYRVIAVPVRGGCRRQTSSASSR